MFLFCIKESWLDIPSIHKQNGFEVYEDGGGEVFQKGLHLAGHGHQEGRHLRKDGTDY